MMKAINSEIYTSKDEKSLISHFLEFLELFITLGAGFYLRFLIISKTFLMHNVEQSNH